MSKRKEFTHQELRYELTELFYALKNDENFDLHRANQMNKTATNWINDRKTEGFEKAVLGNIKSIDSLEEDEVKRLQINTHQIEEGTTIPPESIIDRKELCKRLSITEPTAIRWAKLGKIPEFRIGSAVRYNWPKVIEALEKK